LNNIKKEDYKPNGLRFWIKDGVIVLCKFDLILILVRSHQFFPFLITQQIFLVHSIVLYYSEVEFKIRLNIFFFF